jgi:hypothetical protein
MSVLTFFTVDNYHDNTSKVLEFVKDNPARIKELMSLFFFENNVIVQRCSYSISILAQKDSNALFPYLEQLFDYLENPRTLGHRRNILRILKEIQIPDEWHGKLVDDCFKFIYDKKEEIAVICFSLELLGIYCKTYPELAIELNLAIDSLVPFRSAGIKSRAIREKKKLVNFALN